jgi:hypothetical protein
MSFERDALSQPRPRRVRALATGSGSVSVTRMDATTLKVRPERGFLADSSDTMLRSPRNPLPQGRAVNLLDVSIDVPSLTPDGRPAEALFRFKAPLDDPNFIWLQWKDGAYAPFAVPIGGQTITLAPVDLVALFFPPH